MIENNENLELDAVKLLSDSYQTAGIIVAERILFGKIFNPKDAQMSKFLISSEDLEGAINSIMDIDESQLQGDEHDFLFYKKCIVAASISVRSFDLAKRGNMNSLNYHVDVSIKHFLEQALNKYPQFSGYNVDYLADKTDSISERLLDVCAVSDAIDDLAHILRSSHLTNDQKIEAITKVLSALNPRLYLDFQSSREFFSEHFTSMEEFLIFESEFNEDYPTLWFD